MQRPQKALSVEVLEEIYRRRFRRFVRVALAVVGEPEAAGEVVQDAFANALRSRFEFRGDGSADAWVWAIVVNQARTAARARGPLREVDAGEAPGATNGQEEPWPELRAAVAALPERQRLAIFLRHYADLDYGEIAAVLRIERGTVAATLHAARATLRKQLAEVAR